MCLPILPLASLFISLISESSARILKIYLQITIPTLICTDLSFFLPLGWTGPLLTAVPSVPALAQPRLPSQALWTCSSDPLLSLRYLILIPSCLVIVSTMLKHIPAYFKNSIFPLLHMHPGIILFSLPFTVGIQERWTILGLHRCPQVCFGPAQFNWNFLYQCFYIPPYLPHLPYTLNVSLAFGTVCPFSNLRVCDTPSSICWQLSHSCFSLSFFPLRVGNSYRSFLNYLFSIGMVTNNLLHTHDSINNFMLIMHKRLSPVHIFLLDFRPKYSSIDLYAGGCHRHLKLSKSEMEFVTHYSSPVVLFACACTHTHTHTHTPV